MLGMLRGTISGLQKTLTPITMILLIQRIVNKMASGKMYSSEVFMRKRYLMDRKSPEEIAKECGCSVETIYVYLAKFGLRKSKR
jgi:hypothetical protein